MRKAASLILLLAMAVGAAAQVQPAKFEKNGGLWRLTQNGKPLLMLAGETHNSTASTGYSLAKAFATLKAMGLNAALVPVTWEQLEPQEGKFDFSLTDSIISLAERHGMHVVVLWFGTWKNGESSYAPLWVKRDVGKYFRVKKKNGDNTTTISPFCAAACEADGKAFAHLMRHIKTRDTGRWIAAIQVENEVGCFQDRDYSEAANKAYSGDGSRESLRGFMTTAYARYLDKVAKAGKREYGIPMFANCWLADEKQEFGGFPNGGPLPFVLDIWKKEAPSLDWLSPDIYAKGNSFKEVCAKYAGKDNMLFIPETWPDPACLWYAFGECDAQGFSPFAIEDYYADDFFTGSVGVFRELLPTVAKYQGSGNMRAFFRAGDEDSTVVEMGDLRFTIHYIKQLKRQFGMIVRLSPGEFLFSGMGARIFVANKNSKTITRFTNIRDVAANDGKWVTTQMLNGDQTHHNKYVLLRGRTKNEDHGGIPAPLTDISNSRITFDYNLGRFTLPGIYLAETYDIPQK